MPEEIQLLWEMVRRPSPSGGEGPLARFLCDHLNASGWSAGIDGTGNLIAERGQGERVLLFLGHLDTAPGWPEPVNDGTVIRGRGSVDAKGAMAAFIAGVARVGGGARLILVGAVGEEADSCGTRAVVGRYRPDLCVVGEPSGWDAITLGYKGCVRVSVRVTCPCGHAAGAGAGRADWRTAAEAAVAYWTALRAGLAVGDGGAAPAVAVQATPSFSRPTATLRGFSVAGDGLTETAELDIDLRLPLGPAAEAVEAALRAAAAGMAGAPTPADGLAAAGDPGPALSVAWRMGEVIPAFVANKGNTLVRAFLPAIRAAGGEPRFKRKSGTSDMNIVGPVWNCPILAYGPGDSSLDHTPDERLCLAEYALAIHVWREVLTSL